MKNFAINKNNEIKNKMSEWEILKKEWTASKNGWIILNTRWGNFKNQMSSFQSQVQYLIETSLLTLQYFLIIFQLPTIKKELIAMGYNPEEMNQKNQDQIEKSKEVVKKKDEDN